MKEPQSWYTWVCEPVITPERQADLRLAEQAACEPLSEAALAIMIDRVNHWYDVYYAGSAQEEHRVRGSKKP